ncbi:Eukaryotic translation initiation factor 4 gamma 3 [Folsomia candida]|uniref:Eukaryotic translation initiation factor 4 gamma 3 n=1 Tax=Folsomia candida TaxID=158441 RepID=A0A226D1I3_FOLCA|nr:Eukaryotic translation initiation factor 4 gamma 3 [Folsomia candida]
MTTHEITEDVELTILQLLDKLTHSNFDEVLPDFKNIQVDAIDQLAILVFEIMLSKVDKNPGRASVFARLISKWYRPKYNLRKEILSQCDTEFELSVENMDENMDRFKSNIGLLGELYNCFGISQTKIMDYVDILLALQDDLSVVILCILIRTIGRKLDKTVKECSEETKLAKISFLKLETNLKFVQWGENLFDVMSTISNDGSLSLTSITVVKEILQLRKNNWKAVLATSKSRKKLNLGSAVNSVPTFKQDFPHFMSHFTEEDKNKAFNPMKAQPVESTDTVSSSSGEFDVDTELTVRQILNKLSHSNFDEVLPDFISIEADDIDHLANLVVDIMLSKLDRNPSNASVFARLVRRAYYTTNVENNSLKLVLLCKENFFKQLMVVGAMSGRGVLPLIKVPQKVKESSKYDVDRVSFHHDGASSQTAKLIQDNAKDLEARLGIKIISNSEVPVQSPDISQMDLFGISNWYRPKFDVRKGILKRCRAEFVLCLTKMDTEVNLESVDQSELDRLKSNIRLLGELYNCYGISHKKIMNFVDSLLNRNTDLSVTILCDLIRTIGCKLDKTVKEFTEETVWRKSVKTVKFLRGVENLFDDLTTRSNSGSLSSSSKTDVKEILELRKNNWKAGEVTTTTRAENNANLYLENDRDIELTIRQMLNKISHSNFDEVLEDFTTTLYFDDGEVNLTSLFVDIMMKKVVKKPTSAGVFARLIYTSDQLSELRKVVLDRCQIEFHSIVAGVDKIKESEDNLLDNDGISEEFDKTKSECMKRSGGQIRLIGELYNYDVLGQSTIMRCVNVLSKRHHDVTMATLCALITTIGVKLDKAVDQFKEDEQTSLNLAKLKDDAEFVDWIETLFQNLEGRIICGFLSQNSETAVQNFARLNNNKLESSNISKSSSRMSTSSNSGSDASFGKEDDSVSKRSAELTDAMSSVKLTPYLATEKEEGFDPMKAQLEKSTDTISCSRGKSNVIRESTNADPEPSRSANSIENNSEIGASLPSSCPPQLKYLSMYTNYDRMLTQMPPEVVEDINMQISAIIYQHFKYHKDLERFRKRQNDFENGMFYNK